jgi:hypothetical protein
MPVETGSGGCLFRSRASTSGALAGSGVTNCRRVRATDRRVNQAGRKDPAACPSARKPSMVSLQFTPSPMVVFAIGIEHALDVPVKRPHDADARKHGRSAASHQH